MCKCIKPHAPSGVQVPSHTSPVAIVLSAFYRARTVLVLDFDHIGRRRCIHLGDTAQASEA